MSRKRKPKPSPAPQKPQPAAKGRRCFALTLHGRCPDPAKRIFCNSHVWWWLTTPVAIVLSLGGLAAAINESRELFSPPQLEIVDVKARPAEDSLHIRDSTAQDEPVSFSFAKPAGIPTLDIRLRNPGEVAVVTRIDLEVFGRWRWQVQQEPGSLRSSREYDITLSTTQQTPFTTSVEASQLIPTGGGDRFGITLKTDAPPGTLDSYIFHLRPCLIFDASQHRRCGAPIVVIIGTSHQIIEIADSGSPERHVRVLLDNRVVSLELHLLNAELSDQVRQVLSEFDSFSASAVAHYRSHLSHPFWLARVRSAAILGLLGKEAESALPELRALAATDDVPRVRATAAQAVAQIQASGL